ncbi:MAG: toll/interleukin-1 receptor domain-containing protein [Micropepsaceae bacterium]
MSADPADDIDIAASYSRRDAAAVVPLLDALKARGVKVWFDKNIPGGALWEETITRNMRRAKAVVFFASKESLASDRCFDEVSAARTLKRPIIPVLVEALRIPDDLPDRLVLTLQTRHTVDAWPGAEGDPVDQIMRALQGFGVRSEPRADTPAPAVAASPPSPPLRPASAPAPAPATRKGLSPLVIGGVALAVVAAAAAALFGTGVIGGATAKLDIPAEQWCLASAPALLGAAEAQVGMEALKRAADAGDRDALTLQCLSANKACTGGGDPRGLAPAYAACEQAGAKGSWRAVFNQGWLKQRGCGVTVDGNGAAQAVMRSAEGGCAIAQFYLGMMYQDGELVEYDIAKAIRWLTASSDQNYPPAMNRLGAAYALGRGVPEDDARAAELYRRAADLGDVRAMINYARVLEQGIGIEKNSGAAIAYYRRAAAQSEDAEIKEEALNSLKRLGVSP